MYREVLHRLTGLCTGGERKRILLDGPSGGGKSVALAALAARQRSAGALVLYIPSAFALTQDAFFYRQAPPPIVGTPALSIRYCGRQVRRRQLAQFSYFPRCSRTKPESTTRT